MAYTVTNLINDAWNLSGVVAPELETVDGFQITKGLQLLNQLLSLKTIDYRKIPYYTTYQFNAVTGQQTYFIAGLTEVETFTFFLNTVRYSMIPQYRKHYFGSPRAEGVTSLPYSWFCERTHNGSNLSIYFFPDQDYLMEIHGRFDLPQYTLDTINTDLSLSLEGYYTLFLQYELAAYICDFYNIQFLPQNSKRLRELERKIDDSAPFDFAMYKVSSLQAQTGFNYADVNIGHQWRPA